MDFDDNEEDCTIYIEELKSDDPNLKMNAVVKIQKISEILGPKRVRDELIPYIIDIIEELDNEDEFLIKLSDQVMNLKDFIGGKEHTHLLISPLEILSSLEEISIREKSVESLQTISEDQSNTFYCDNFLPMIRQLAKWDNYPSRISACQLIGSCFQYFQVEQQNELINLFTELCKDDTPMVRRTASDNIPQLTKKISDKQVILDSLIPVWVLLIKDDIDSVKVKAIECSIDIAQKLSKKEVSTEIVKNVMEIIKNKNYHNINQWRIRYAIAEILAPLLPFLEKSVTKNEIIILYDELLKDQEHEVKSITIHHLPELCSHLSTSELAQQILPLFNTLVSDASQHVRSSLAEVICKIASSFDKSQIISGILPIIETLLKDEIVEVRVMVLNSMYLLNNVIGEQEVGKHIVPLFRQVIQEKQWRYRLQFCELLPKFRQQLGFETFKTFFKETIMEFSKDHFAFIREQNFKNLHEIALDVGFSKIKGIFNEMRDSMLEGKNYIFRVSLLQGLQLLKEVLTEQEINQNFDILMDSLYEEQVPNVLLNLAKTYLAFEDKLFINAKNRFNEFMQEKIDDQDSDVQYYANLIVNNPN